jgi:hypothetical protein
MGPALGKGTPWEGRQGWDEGGLIDCRSQGQAEIAPLLREVVALIPKA